MWTEITRAKYERHGLRYASDLTCAEWNLIEPHMPPAKAVGRPRTTDLREVVNAILYLLRAGCPWRMLPRESPPRSTVQRYFYAWRDDATWQGINHHLLMALREAEGCMSNLCGIRSVALRNLPYSERTSTTIYASMFLNGN